MKTRLYKTLIRIHFVALISVILNSITNNFTSYSLAGEIDFGIKILVVFSGLALFFLYLKPFKKINIYFLIYPIMGFILAIGLIVRGILGAVIISLILFPILPNDKKYKSDGIVISTPFSGFLASCCSYQIKERKLCFFEKNHGFLEEVGEGPIDFTTMKVESNKTHLILSYSTNFDKGVIKNKTIKR